MIVETESTLYRKNQLGIGSWRIWYEILDSANATLYYAHATTLGGAWVHHKDHIVRNQSGRSIQEQVELEMRSRISRQKDKGYKTSIEEARDGVTNQMGFVNPMLAQPIDKVRVTDSQLVNAYIQRKYDGHRTLITNYGGELVPYTRKGKPITTIGHILKQLNWLPEGVTIDGELYIHGTALQGISSIVKRVQADNVKLRFHWYDLKDERMPSLPYAARYARMKELIKHLNGNVFDGYEIVETLPVTSMVEAWEYFRRFRAEKYEGAMLRLNNKPYQDSIRSSSLLKLKWEDGREEIEVEVVGARPSREGWAILDCKMPNGKRFDTAAPGSVPEKHEVMRNFDKYLGRKLTIEFANYTNDGLPFHAVATRWHEEI